MSEPTTYEIVLRGRPSTRLLRPLLDEFIVEAPIDNATGDATRLVGDICDPAHLNGVVAHLTSVNVEIHASEQVEGCDPLPGCSAGWGYGVTRDTKEVPENCTNIYRGIYHGAFLCACVG
ncbi:MAG: hypothetical protein HOI41_03630 [Acidimicrobiaceae bacterium]|nr:hypothetical protein [Acidimicrobiaceae bacterium]